MRVLRTYAIQVDFAYVGRQAGGKRDARCGKAVVSGWKTRSVGTCGVVSFPFGDVQNLNLYGAFRAGRDAGRLAAFRQAVVAHVAFADYPAFRVVLRHSVGTVPGAVLATDTGLGVVDHHTCDRVFGVCVDRTAL